MAVLKRPGEDRPPTTRQRRLWTVAPAPAPSAQSFDGHEILDELPTDTGLVLFEWFRAVRLWTMAERGNFAGLFGQVGEADELTSWRREAIVSPLHSVAPAFASLRLTPERSRPDELVHACAFIAEWAAEDGLAAIAALFAEAAAWLAPNDPDLAFRAGRANRRNVSYDRAALWFQRGTGTARRSANWTAYVDCWLGWGNLEITRGRYAPARRLLTHGFRAAQKYNLRELGAAAQHDLFMLCVDQRQFAEAYKHASAALTLYSPDDASFPYLVHDLAQTWALEGYGMIALPVLLAVREYVTAPSAQVQIAGNIAGAAGLVGDMDAFYSAWDEVSRFATRPVPFVASALVSVAEGAYALRLNRQAADAAASALRFAQQRQEPTEERRALEILDKLRRAEPPALPRGPPEEIRTLAAVLLSRLRERTELR